MSYTRNRKISTSVKTATKSVCSYQALNSCLDLHGDSAESTEDHGNSGQGSTAGCVEGNGAGGGGGTWLAPETSGRTIGRASGRTGGSVVRNEGSGGLGCGAGRIADGHSVVRCLSGGGGSSSGPGATGGHGRCTAVCGCAWGRRRDTLGS